jgi:hypothetical protein
MDLFDKDLFSNAEVISSYSRADAIEDGVLVCLMQPETVQAVREAGFLYPVAMTSTAFGLAVWPIDDEQAGEWLRGHGQDLQGRLWDVLNMLKLAIRRHGRAKEILGTPASIDNEVRFQVSIICHEKRCRRLLTLKSVCGPNDDGSPCLTIMLEDED